MNDDDDDDHSKIRSPSSIHEQLHLPQSADTQDPLYKSCQKMHKAQQTQVFNYIRVSWSGSFISLLWLLYLHTTKPKMEEKVLGLHIIRYYLPSLPVHSSDGTKQRNQHHARWGTWVPILIFGPKPHNDGDPGPHSPIT